MQKWNNLPWWNGAFLMVLVVFLMATREDSVHKTIDVLDVKRINIRDENGTIRMVISNKQKQHPGKMDGKDFPPRERGAGILFFNSEGDECGGIMFETLKDGDATYNTMLLTMDQYKNDQVMVWTNQEKIVNGVVSAERGLVFNRFPPKSTLSAMIRAMDSIALIKDKNLQRHSFQALADSMNSKPSIFIGETQGRNGLYLYDKKGEPKLKIYLDENGVPKIQVTGEDGKWRTL